MNAIRVSSGNGIEATDDEDTAAIMTGVHQTEGEPYITADLHYEHGTTILGRPTQPHQSWCTLCYYGSRRFVSAVSVTVAGTPKLVDVVISWFVPSYFRFPLERRPPHQS